MDEILTGLQIYIWIGFGVFIINLMRRLWKMVFHGTPLFEQRHVELRDLSGLQLLLGTFLAHLIAWPVAIYLHVRKVPTF